MIPFDVWWAEHGVKEFHGDLGKLANRIKESLMTKFLRWWEAVGKHRRGYDQWSAMQGFFAGCDAMEETS